MDFRYGHVWWRGTVILIWHSHHYQCQVQTELFNTAHGLANVIVYSTIFVFQMLWGHKFPRNSHNISNITVISFQEIILKESIDTWKKTILQNSFGHDSKF